MIQTPSFYTYFGKTYRIESTPDGGLTGYLLNLRSGEFDEKPEHVREVMWAMASSDISKVSEEKFVQETERARERYLKGSGPVFALYETIDGLYQQARRENRRVEPQESALIRSLRKRTFKMWEDELARRAAGEPPTFRAEPRFPEYKPPEEGDSQ
ncbi:hypothetical protein DL991_05200 [Amycolatopsis sp. WAC 01375]|uniref:hypothetical protein n=1 Tax=unclassified Amycolatopsis TaxID=2618356 RepID=UPI000F76E249|nr:MULTISPECIES: hypothetical protein [unclassified Amycolatopsis]RSM82283.1 hypothetical protein DL991_05200 [Amycolatopsis sp. WAC 01375]RSN38011.1 hypothetical protein DL990_03065 [Amycolatopsis sp. WAC 01416]